MITRLPRLDQYSAAVQNPRIAFTDPELRATKVRTNPLGTPLVAGGGFTCVFPLEGGGKRWAVRCFHKQMTELPERYAKISRFITQHPRPYFVDALFIADGIKVESKFYPIIRMSWVDGYTINGFIERELAQPQQFELLADRFAVIVRELELLGVAHGDLQHGNLMVVGDDLKLIDYDGMFVPELRGKDSPNIGHVNFQHPSRKQRDFDAKIDRFSAMLIYLALRGLALDPVLWKRYGVGGENLLFQQTDFIHPDTSPLLKDLEQLPALAHLIPTFRQICTANLNALPSLDEFLQPQSLPITPAKHNTTTLRRQYEVVRTDDLASLRDHLGDRVEIVGQITLVDRKRANTGQPYTFIDFGNWKEGCFRLVIWSGGLNLFDQTGVKLTTLQGKWVSVTGNIEQHEKRLQIVVELPSQIEVLPSKSEAMKRLQANQAQSSPADSTPPPPALGSGMPRVIPQQQSASQGGTPPGSGTPRQRQPSGSSVPSAPPRTPWDNMPITVSPGGNAAVVPPHSPTPSPAPPIPTPPQPVPAPPVPTPPQPVPAPSVPTPPQSAPAPPVVTATSQPAPVLPSVTSFQPSSSPPVTGATTRLQPNAAPTLICAFCPESPRSTTKVCVVCGRELSPTRFRPGQQLQGRKYKIDRALSRGGMGEVYLAIEQHQTLADRKRIIKVLYDYFDLSNKQAAESAMRRFKQEAKTLSNIKHKHVPEVYDYFEEGRDACIVMQYIEGHDLEQRLTHKDLHNSVIPGQAYDQKEVRGWAITLCQVLEYLSAQAQPVIHQDIKPTNLLLSNDGTIYLVDFGTARTRINPSGQASITKASIYGTPGYAPPEQYQGKTEPRSDVYALAATLYHLATDDDPRQQGAMPRFAKLGDLGEFGQILASALAQDVAQRPSAYAFRTQLESLSYLPRQEPPPSPPPKPVAPAVQQSNQTPSGVNVPPIPVRQPVSPGWQYARWIGALMIGMILLGTVAVFQRGLFMPLQTTLEPTIAFVEPIPPITTDVAAVLASDTPGSIATPQMVRTAAATSLPAAVITLSTATATHTSARSPTRTATPAIDAAPGAVMLSPMRTATPDVDAAQGSVLNGGNMRTSPGGAIIGTVCPGDVFTYMYRQGEWYSIRIERTAVDCVPDRVRPEAGGWVHQSLLSPPQQIVPTVRP